MTIYDKFVQLLKDWQYCPVVPEIRELEKHFASELKFAKAVRLGEESTRDKLVFYIEGPTLSVWGAWYPTGDYEIIAVKSLTHGVQVLAIGENRDTQHIRNVLMKEVE
jgi:hypothetical protein